MNFISGMKDEKYREVVKMAIDMLIRKNGINSVWISI